MTTSPQPPERMEPGRKAFIVRRIGTRYEREILALTPREAAEKAHATGRARNGTAAFTVTGKDDGHETVFVLGGEK